jgi:hypothetical protein
MRMLTMPLAWQSHDHSWMIEDVILNKLFKSLIIILVVVFIYFQLSLYLNLLYYTVTYNI